MELTKKQLDEARKDPLMNFIASLLGTSMDELVNAAEKESCTKEKVAEAKVEPAKPKKEEFEESDAELGKRIKSFFDRMVEEEKATATIEDGHPHYHIKGDERYTEPEAVEGLLEEGAGEGFVMSKEQLKEFVRDYIKLENTFKKLEHTYGIDMNASADSIYTQYNALVWRLIDIIFGEDNRDDIADFCFGNSNLDTVEDLYEELI